MAFTKPPARNMPPGSEPWAQWVEEQMSSVTKKSVEAYQYAERAAGGVSSALEGNVQNWDEINRVFEATENSMQLADGAIVWSKVDPDPNEVPANTNVIWYTYDPVTREVLRMWQWGYYDADTGEYREEWYQAQLGADSIHDEAITSAKVALGAIDWDQIGPGVTATVEGAVSGISDLQETVTSVGGMVTTSGSAPTTEQGTGKPTGAVWYQYSSSNQLNGSWRWSGTAWISMPIGDNAVAELNAAKLTAGVLNAARIASNSIVGDKIVANAITARELAVGAITADKAIIANAAIKSAMIANANILSAHIQDLAVTNAKIANTTITNAKILNLDAGKITTGFLDAARIQANSITADKLRADAIDGKTITGVTITGGTIIQNSLIQGAPLVIDKGTISEWKNVTQADAGLLGYSGYALRAFTDDSNNYNAYLKMFMGGGSDAPTSPHNTEGVMMRLMASGLDMSRTGPDVVEASVSLQADGVHDGSPVGDYGSASWTDIIRAGNNHLQRGFYQHSAGVTTGTAITGTVTFPTAFTSAPTVVGTPRSGRLNLQVNQPTTTGFTWFLRNDSGATTSTSDTGFSWIALGA